ncbi:MAG: hypothetical protein ABR511_10365 [Acidimicrobiales bacterium]
MKSLSSRASESRHRTKVSGVSNAGRPVARALILAALVGTILVPAAASAAPQNPPPGQSKKQAAQSFDGDFSKMAPSRPNQGPSHPGYGHNGTPQQPNSASDPLVAAQVSAPAPAGPGALSGTIRNFEGISNINGVFPPDTNGDVGPNNYIQIVNSSFQIFDKQSPSRPGYTAGPFNTNTLWSTYTPSTSLCRTTNNGDAIVRHDAMADRWVISQFAFNVDSSSNPIAPFEQCFAVSKTSDPVAGGWYLYDFLVSNQRFNDYGKMGIWPDGYYFSFNWNGDAGAGGAFAFDRSNMLNGNPAGFICFGCDTGLGLNGGDNFGNLSGDNQLLPGDLDGSTLPDFGAPETFTRFTGGNTLRSFAMHTDWQVPANSTLTQLTDVTVANFNSSLPDIPQPSTTQTLDSLADRLMYRLQYRRFADHESLVVNHSVNVDGAGHAGVRWYELRRAGTPNWSLYQQGTFAPDVANRWMGSIAMDKTGNMALGYSVASAPASPTPQNPNVFPSIRVSARQAGDPLGLLPQGELTVISGNGSQTLQDTAGRGRWGDYSSMMLDPTDGCTFWYTTEYIQATGPAPWQTRVGSFKFPSCNPADVSITKSATPSPVVAGGELDWHVDATNHGPDAADNVTVVDDLPAGDTPFAVATPPTCTIAGQHVSCALGTLAVGATVPIVIRTQVSPSYDVAGGGPGTVTNTATVSADQLDPNPANNSASSSVVVNEQADLAVNKTCDTSVLAGQPGNCTVFVDNNGPSTSRNVVLTDAASSDGTFTMSAANPSQGTCGPLPAPNQTSGSVTCQLGDVGPATNAGPGRATVVVSYAANEGQTIHDQATATADTPDANSANNSQSASLPVTAVADLRITSDTATPSPVVAGQTLTFSVTVTNAGPSTAKNVVLKNALPTGVTVTSIILPGGSSCNAGVPGDPFQPATCGLDLLGSGSSATMTIVTTVAARTTGTLHADASVTSSTLDNNNSDNFAHTDTAVSTLADLGVTLGDSPDPVVAGTSLTYTAVVTNNGGPSAARTVTLLENLDANVSFQSATISNGGSGTCAQVVGNPHQIQCQLNDLDPNQSDTIYTQVVVNPSAPLGTDALTTTAHVATGTTDSNSGNDDATARTSVRRVADLAANITAPSHKYTPSTTVTFTAVVTNNGPSDDSGVAMVVTLPGTKVGHYVSDNGGTACSHTASATATTVTCTYPTLAAGASRTVQVVYFFQGNQKVQTGSEGVSSPTSATTDPVSANNTSSWTVGPK